MLKEEKSKRIVFDFGGKIRISPPMWPDSTIDIQPGDLSRFLPNGNGVYGYQEKNGNNPLTSAPSQEACGGVIYFGNKVTKEDFFALLRILEVRATDKDYAVFINQSETPVKDGCLTQMRIVSKFGLRFMFGAIDDNGYDSFQCQEMTIADALWTFMEKERERWGTSFTEDGEKGLRGLFGGDGDFAREELSFGFMPENDYHSIYRIWSRAWLVTK